MFARVWKSVPVDVEGEAKDQDCFAVRAGTLEIGKEKRGGGEGAAGVLGF